MRRLLTLSAATLVVIVCVCTGYAGDLTVQWYSASNQSYVMSPLDHVALYSASDELDVLWRQPAGSDRAWLLRGLYRWNRNESHRVSLDNGQESETRHRHGFVEFSVMWETLHARENHETLWRLQLDLPGPLGRSERTVWSLPGVRAVPRLSGQYVWRRTRDPVLLYAGVKPTVGLRRKERGEVYRIGPQVSLQAGMIYALTRDVSLHVGLVKGWKTNDSLGAQVLAGTKATWTDVLVTATYAASFQTEWQLGIVLPISQTQTGAMQFGLRKYFD